MQDAPMGIICITCVRRRTFFVKLYNLRCCPESLANWRNSKVSKLCLDAIWAIPPSLFPHLCLQWRVGRRWVGWCVSVCLCFKAPMMREPTADHCNASLLTPKTRCLNAVWAIPPMLIWHSTCLPSHWSLLLTHSLKLFNSSLIDWLVYWPSCVSGWLVGNLNCVSGLFVLTITYLIQRWSSLSSIEFVQNWAQNQRKCCIAERNWQANTSLEVVFKSATDKMVKESIVVSCLLSPWDWDFQARLRKRSRTKLDKKGKMDKMV